MHKTTSSASLVLKFVLSSTTHISTNSYPFLVGIVSELAALPFIVLTSSDDWDPHHVRFPSHDVEEANKATINAIQSRQQQDLHRYGYYNVKPGLQGTVDDPATFSIRLISAVQVHDPTQLKEDVPSFKTFHTSERKSTVSASDLSERWFIGGNPNHQINITAVTQVGHPTTGSMILS